jgi:hypothetical protein
VHTTPGPTMGSQSAPPSVPTMTHQ